MQLIPGGTCDRQDKAGLGGGMAEHISKRGIMEVSQLVQTPGARGPYNYVHGSLLFPHRCERLMLIAARTHWKVEGHSATHFSGPGAGW